MLSLYMCHEVVDLLIGIGGTIQVICMHEVSAGCGG